MREGVIYFDRASGRYDVVFDDADPERGAYYGGLHCGDCLTVLHNGAWVETSIESNTAKYTDWRSWYLTGIDFETIIDGMRARI